MGVVQNLSYILLGEDRTASKAMQAAESTAQKVTGTIGSAFNKLGGVIGGEFGGMLQQAGGQIEQLSAKGKSLSATLEVGGAITAGAGIALMQLGSGAKQSTDQLNQAIKNAGDSVADYGHKVDEAVARGENFDHSAEDTKGALLKLIPAAGSTQKALDQMGVVTDLAAAKHISLTDAAGQVAKILGGSGAKTLTQYGITMQKAVDPSKALASAQAGVTSASTTLAVAQKRLADLQEIDSGKKKLTISDHIALRNAEDSVATASGKLSVAQQKLAGTSTQVITKTQAGQDALDQLSKKLNGQASASVDNFGSQFDIVKTKVEDFVKDAAGPVGQTMTVLGPIFSVAGLAIDAYKTKTANAALAQIAMNTATDAQTAAATASVAATDAETTSMAGLDVAMDANPIGVVALALGGLAAVTGGVLLANQQAITSSEQQFTSALQSNTGALNENIRASATKQLNDSGALAAARELGLSQATAVDAALGNAKAIAQVSAALEKYRGDAALSAELGLNFLGVKNVGTAALTLNASISTVSQGLKDSKQSQIDYKAGLDETAGSASKAAAQVANLAHQVSAAASQSGEKVTYTVTGGKTANHAAGGVFTKPTTIGNDTFGESGPESWTVTPLNAGRMGGTGGGDVHIHLNVAGSVIGNDKQFQSNVISAVINGMRQGGSKIEFKRALGLV